MESVAGFKEVAPYLTHPLVLVGFILFLFFGIHRTLLRAKIIPPLEPGIIRFFNKAKRIKRA